MLQLLLAGALVAARPPVAHAAAPRLEVSAERITLGDINPTLPRELLAVDVAPAPLPGRHITLSRDAIRGALTRAGADASLADGMPAHVTVERQAKRVSRAELERELLSLVRAELPLGVTVGSVLGLDDLLLPAGEHETRLQLGRLRQATSATLTVSAHGRTWKRMPITLNLEGTPSTPTLREARPRAAVIAPDDVVMAPTSLDAIPPRAALRREELVGRMLTQPTAAGSTIQTSALRAKPVIERGRELTLVVVGKGLRITQAVRAEQDGLVDEWIRVRSIDGGRVIEARVTGPGEVALEIGATR